MSSWSEEVEDLLVATSLGAASADEVAWVERAAATDPELAQRLWSLREASAMLAEDVPLVTPPSAIRTRLLSEVGGEPHRDGGVGHVRRLGWPVPAIAAAAAAAAIAIGVVASLDRTEAGVREVAVEQVASAAIEGELVVFPDDQPSVLRLRGLEPLDPGLGYAVWRFDGADVESNGFLSVTADGHGVAAVPDTDEIDRVAVTIEARGELDAPTSTPLVELDTA